ncbi:MAG: membrane protein [Gammaproteobacteria bacterium]|nr:MAG: membrane protein [Gammaproteobacteria bacterium]
MTMITASKRRREPRAMLQIAMLFSALQAGAPAPAAGTAQEDPAKAGRALAEAIDRRDDGFGDYQARLHMVIIEADGARRSRDLRYALLEGRSEGDRSLITFLSPADVEGTTLLTHAHKDRDDDQWLYLPALKRVKRISSSNRAGAFMGSAFAYEDLAGQDIDKYHYRLLGETEHAGQPAFLLERIPDYSGTGYSRQRLTVDKAELRILSIEFFNHQGVHEKTLTMEGYRLHTGRHWRADRMHMVNHLDGRATILEWSEHRFGTGLSEFDFAVGALGRDR